MNAIRWINRIRLADRYIELLAHEGLLSEATITACMVSRRCFNYAALSLWIAPSADIRESKTMETLKTRLKTHCFLVHCGHWTNLVILNNVKI